MGHKVNPISFRIPYIKSWKSTWYEDKKTYKDSLGLDIKARTILTKELT
jgi:small subunit ribosomal protein S3